jgi:hypothetical protein
MDVPLDRYDKSIQFYAQYPTNAIYKLLAPCRNGQDLKEIKKLITHSPAIEGLEYEPCEHSEKEALLTAIRRYQSLRGR